MLTQQHKKEVDGKADVAENSVESSDELEQKKKELFGEYKDEAVKSLNIDSPDIFNREETPVHKSSRNEWIKSLLKRGKGVVEN